MLDVLAELWDAENVLDRDRFPRGWVAANVHLGKGSGACVTVRHACDRVRVSTASVDRVGTCQHPPRTAVGGPALQGSGFRSLRAYVRKRMRSQPPSADAGGPVQTGSVRIGC